MRFELCIVAVMVVEGDCILWLGGFGVMSGMEKGASFYFLNRFILILLQLLVYSFVTKE